MEASFPGRQKKGQKRHRNGGARAIAVAALVANAFVPPARAVSPYRPACADEDAQLQASLDTWKACLAVPAQPRARPSPCRAENDAVTLAQDLYRGCEEKNRPKKTEKDHAEAPNP